MLAAVSRTTPPLSSSPPPAGVASSPSTTVPRACVRRPSIDASRSIVGFIVPTLPPSSRHPPPAREAAAAPARPDGSEAIGSRTLMGRRSVRWFAHRVLPVCILVARRLGIPRVVSRLEDRLLELLAPRIARSLQRGVADICGGIDIAWAVHRVERALGEHRVEYVAVHGRRKSLLSIWKKARGGRDVNDILALRIIVATAGGESECRRALQVASDLFARLGEAVSSKDYISAPKDNGYQSLHRTFMLDEADAGCGRRHGDHRRFPLEIQVRTEAMHVTSDRGSAAHWRYKQRGPCKNLP